MTFQRNNWCQMAKPVERSGSKIARAVNCGYNDYVWEVDILIGRYGRSVCARGGGGVAEDGGWSIRCSPQIRELNKYNNSRT